MSTSSYFGYYAGSQDYWNHQSLCWAGKVENGCFENTTGTGEAVTGLDLHNGTATVHSSEYSTTLYTTVADQIIQRHVEAYRDDTEAAAAAAAGGGGGRGGTAVTKPLFLYLPHQVICR